MPARMKSKAGPARTGRFYIGSNGMRQPRTEERDASGVNASEPYASAAQTES